MSNSPLVEYTLISPHRTSPRVYPITKITIHHMAGNLTIEQCGKLFQSRQACSNYGIDGRGRVGMYCEEKDRAWCSANYDNDHRAVNIELANDGGAPDWHVADITIEKCIELCVDICKRNNIARLNFTGDASGNLTQHNFFCATACPGPYLKSKFNYIADEVNRRLGGESPLPQDTPTQVICGFASKGDLKAFAALMEEIGTAAIYPEEGYIASAIALTKGDQKRLVDLGVSLGVSVMPYIAEGSYGIPVPRDIYTNQVEVLIDDLYCRTEPNLSRATRLGFITKGIYNVYDTYDGRKDSNNGYFWYRVDESLWIPSGDWLVYYAAQDKPSDDKDKKIAELQAENEKLLQEIAILESKLEAAQSSLKVATSGLQVATGDLQDIAAIADNYKA